MTTDARPSPGQPAEALLEVRDLVKHFTVTGGPFGRQKGVLRAVDGVSFAIRRG